MSVPPGCAILPRMTAEGRLEAPSLDEIRAARARIAGEAVRTPLLRLFVDAPCEIYLKL